MTRPRYQDYLNELAAGQTYGIFVDDTGSPGLKDTPPNCDRKRKSWVAVVVPPEIMPEVCEQFPLALEELKKQTGATEFHFTEIYGGRKQFKDVDFDVRFALIEFSAAIAQVLSALGGAARFESEPPPHC